MLEDQTLLSGRQDLYEQCLDVSRMSHRMYLAVALKSKQIQISRLSEKVVKKHNPPVCMRFRCRTIVTELLNSRGQKSPSVHLYNILTLKCDLSEPLLNASLFLKRRKSIHL